MLELRLQQELNMADIIVKLSALVDLEPVIAEQKSKGVIIRQGRPEETQIIADWVREHFDNNWAMGCEVSLEQEPVTCFIAVKENASNNSSSLTPDRLVGFACYDVVTKGVLGPIGMPEEIQNSDIETALSLVCLHTMAGHGYEFATMGWTAFIRQSSKM